MAAWGEHEDDPDYLCAYRLQVVDRPGRWVFADPTYYAREGDMPDSLHNVTIEFSIRPENDGSQLTVTQTGLPSGEEAFCEGCKKGWETTLAQLQAFLNEPTAVQDETM